MSRTASGLAVSVRTARLEDTAEIAALAGQLGYPTATPAMKRRMQDLLGRPDHGLLVAVGGGGYLLGWVHIYLRSLVVQDQFAELGGMIVAEGTRSRGVGAALLGAAERWASSQGAKQMIVRSNQIRERAHVFYQQLGYELIKRSLVFHKELG